MYMLFSDFKDTENEEVIPIVNQISSIAALIAAENFVKICFQHCLFLSDKGILDNEIKGYSEGYVYTPFIYILCIISVTQETLMTT